MRTLKVGVLTYSGTSDRGEDGYERTLQGGQTDSGTPVYISPRLHTSHANYLWLNRLHCVGVGRVFPERAEVSYDVYAIRVVE